MSKLKAFDCQLNTKETLHPQIPFSWMVIGKRGSGKTTLVLNYILTEFKNKFEECYVICPTYNSDEKLQLLEKKSYLLNKKKEENFSYFSGSFQSDKKKKLPSICLNPLEAFDFIENIKKRRKALIEKQGRDKVGDILLYIDDMLGTRFIRSNELKMFIANSRHIKCSVVISSQSYKSIDKTIRLNTTFLTVFPTSNIVELKTIYDENNTDLNNDEFIQITKTIFAENGRHFISFNHMNPMKKVFIKDNEKFCSDIYSFE